MLHIRRHRRVLVTMWLPAHLRPMAAARYDGVPRTTLRGRADQWPMLPPVYPGAAAEWQQRHRHVVYRPEPDR